MKEPETLQEWQTAVDAAHVALAVDAAREYGLIAISRRTVDVQRCIELLSRGKAQGVEPSIDCIERGFTWLIDGSISGEHPDALQRPAPDDQDGEDSDYLAFTRVPRIVAAEAIP